MSKKKNFATLLSKYLVGRKVIKIYTPDEHALSMKFEGQQGNLWLDIYDRGVTGDDGDGVGLNLYELDERGNVKGGDDAIPLTNEIWPAFYTTEEILTLQNILEEQIEKALVKLFRDIRFKKGIFKK